MTSKAYQWLVSGCAADDANYKNALKEATKEELERAIEELENGFMNKTRILACERELRKRS